MVVKIYLKITKHSNYNMSNNYYEIFVKQFIQTLAQFGALALSTTLAVPLYSYYSRKNLNKNVEEHVEVVDEVSEEHVSEQDVTHQDNSEQSDSDNSDTEEA